MRRSGQSEIIDVPKLVRENKEKWVNINLTEVNDSIVRLGIFEGEFHWNKHDTGHHRTPDPKVGDPDLSGTLRLTSRQSLC